MFLLVYYTLCTWNGSTDTTCTDNEVRKATINRNVIKNKTKIITKSILPIVIMWFWFKGTTASVDSAIIYKMGRKSSNLDFHSLKGFSFLNIRVKYFLIQVDCIQLQLEPFEESFAINVLIQIFIISLFSFHRERMMKLKCTSLILISISLLQNTASMNKNKSLQF